MTFTEQNVKRSAFETANDPKTTSTSAASLPTGLARVAHVGGFIL